MKRSCSYILILVMALFSLTIREATAQVKTGIEILRERDFDLLKGKRVGLVTNPTGVDRQLRSTIDILHEHVQLTALFGKDRKPDREALEQVDVIVYDIQDIGVRSYTYISTMGLVMEAAADLEKEVVILDRPNPLGGLRVEGPLVKDGFHSFVSQYSIPYIYGLTCGELALFLNGEGMLDEGRRCKLQVVPMEGWSRAMTFDGTGLQWVPTSPHIPDYKTAFYYPATGIIGELDPNMIGIGYTLPFQTLVTEHIDAGRLADSMNALGLEGVIFRPIHLKPYYMAKKGQALQGVQIHLTDPGNAVLTEIQFCFLQEARKIDPAFDVFAGREDRDYIMRKTLTFLLNQEEDE